MVCKTCRDARAYLDVTETEYATLKELAADFTMETLVYHTRLLEGALSSIQKATLAKRSTAELTLTRLCEPRLSSDTTALLSRIARLEEEVSRLRLGIPATPPAVKEQGGEAPTEKQSTDKVTPSSETKSASPVKESAPQSPADGEEYRVLPYWRSLLEALAERKPSLIGFFQKAKGYYSKKRGYLIKVAGDFAVALINGPDVLLTIKTLISECEGRNILSEPFLVVSDAKAKADALAIIEELEELIDNND
jgi:DNA polymerase III gamma/tau subunit